MDTNTLLIGLYLFGLLVLGALMVYEYPDYKRFREEAKKRKAAQK